MGSVRYRSDRIAALTALFVGIDLNDCCQAARMSAWGRKQSHGFVRLRPLAVLEMDCLSVRNRRVAVIPVGAVGSHTGHDLIAAVSSFLTVLA